MSEMKHWCRTLAVLGIAAIGAVAWAAPAPDDPRTARPPRPEGIRILSVDERPDAPGRLYAIYLIRYEDGQLAVVVRWQTEDPEHDVFVGSLLPIGCPSPDPELFLPLPKEEPSPPEPPAPPAPQAAG